MLKDVHVNVKMEERNVLWMKIVLLNVKEELMQVRLVLQVTTVQMPVWEGYMTVKVVIIMKVVGGPVCSGGDNNNNPCGTVMIVLMVHVFNQVVVI